MPHVVLFVLQLSLLVWLDIHFLTLILIFYARSESVKKNPKNQMLGRRQVVDKKVHFLQCSIVEMTLRISVSDL